MLDQIRQMLSEQLDIDIDEITEDSDLMSDLNADSLDIVEFISNLEDTFGVMIPQDNITNVHTVGDVAELLESLDK